MKKLTEFQKSRKLKKIDRLKKELRYENTKYGGYHDGRGLRYVIAELYFEINDYKKTNRYLNWFFKIFPGDVTYPHIKLGASFASFQAKKYKKAIDFLVEINSDNTYILSMIAGNKIEDQDKQEFMFGKLNWAEENKEELLDFIDVNFLTWITEIIQTKKYLAWYNKYISILKLIKDLEVSDERTDLLNASYQCLKDWKLDMNRD